MRSLAAKVWIGVACMILVGVLLVQRHKRRGRFSMR